MTDDPRSGRVAVVADSLLEEKLPELRDGNWGVIQLPPAGLGAEATRDWLALTAEQVAEFVRTGYEVVLLDDGAWRQALGAELTRLGAAPL